MTTPPPSARHVCVLGLGLIGGSVLRAATAAGWQGWGLARAQETVDAARADGFDATTDPAAALGRARDTDALVVLAVPVTALDAQLRLVAEHAPGCALTDVVSVAVAVTEAVRRRGLAARHVGGHPMAGTTESGWSAGSAGLFRDAAWVVAADDGLDVAVWQRVARLALDCGARVVPAGAAAHDDAVARISHLPHLLAAVLASVGADGGPLALGLAAGSFRDGTRVAGTDPALVAAMCEANGPALRDAVDDALGRLGAARGALASTGTVGATVRGGHTAKLDQLEHAPAEITGIDFTAPDVLARLRAAGHAGGVLRSLG
ncbi:prephenate dehydrogenase [Rhodococcus aerolatus]